MNIITTGFLFKFQYPILYNILNEFKVDKCHLVYSLEKIPVPPFTEAIYYKHSELKYHSPKTILHKKIRPIDEEILNRLEHCEVIVLRQMDRWHSNIYNKYQFHMFYNYRKKFYLDCVRYWNHIIEEDNIDLAIFDNIPHQIYDYIIYWTCKIKNIPIIILSQTKVDDTIIFNDSIEEPNIELKKTYERLLEEYESVQEPEIELKGPFMEHYQEQIDKTNFDTPHWFKNKLKRGQKKPFVVKVIIFIKTILRTRKISINILRNNFKRYYKFVKENKHLAKYYDKIATEPDLSKKFVYLPLQRHPERNSSPLAGAYVDQELIVQLISYSLPQDFFLYVKEHPIQEPYMRNKGFYDKLIRQSNVRLIKRNFNSTTLINHSMAVATATGTPGWEALFREKHVILYGRVYYQYMKGVFLVRTVEDCKTALNQILNNNIKPTKKSIKLFLKALELNSIKGYLTPTFKDVSKITIDENVKNIS
jgi:hypothetical protein